MKKLVLTAAVMGFAASMASAQVYSQNIVGYNKDVSMADSFHIAGYPFQGEATPESVFGTSLPLGSVIYTFGEAGYSSATLVEDFDWDTFQTVTNWSASIDLSGCVGFWVENTSGADVTSVLSGEVILDAAVTNSIRSGYQLLSYPYPVARDVSELGLNAQIGDEVFAFGSTGYSSATLIEDFNWDTFETVTNWSSALTIDVGEGFWFNAAQEGTWIVERPFNP